MTLPAEPVVTPRPPIRSTWLRSRQMLQKRSSYQAERAQSPLTPWIYGRDDRGQHEHRLAIFRICAMVPPGRHPRDRTRVVHLSLIHI